MNAPSHVFTTRLLVMDTYVSPSLELIVPLDLSLLIDDVMVSKSYMVSGSGAR